MGSADVKFPVRYQDPDYQENHRALFLGKLLKPLESVLPPGVSQQDFNSAIAEFEKVVGKDYVFTGASLEEYVDPYELWENEGKRRMPSGAVWYVAA